MLQHPYVYIVTIQLIQDTQETLRQHQIMVTTARRVRPPPRWNCSLSGSKAPRSAARKGLSSPRQALNFFPLPGHDRSSRISRERAMCPAPGLLPDKEKAAEAGYNNKSIFGAKGPVVLSEAAVPGSGSCRRAGVEGAAPQGANTSSPEYRFRTGAGGNKTTPNSARGRGFRSAKRSPPGQPPPPTAPARARRYRHRPVPPAPLAGTCSS